MKKLSNETRVKFHAHTVDSSSFCFLKKGKKKKKNLSRKLFLSIVMVVGAREI